jgi:DNA-binding beta-propeller fold protein YncE
MVLRADQDKAGAAAGPTAAWPRIGAGIAAGAARTAGPRARWRAMAAAVTCAALLAGLGAAAPAAASAAREDGPAAVPGGQLWASLYDGPAGTGGYAFAVAVSPDGATVFVTGNSFGGASGTDYGTVAYDAATGAQRWASRYSGPASHVDYANSVAVSPDGATVYVTGTSQGATSGQDYTTLAYNAATGAQLWARRYNGPANGDDSASKLAVSPGGATVFVTGLSQGASGFNYATVAYNAATGARRWVRRAPANRDDRGSSLAVSPGGATVFVAGTSRGASNLDYATIAYNAATGARRWASRYNAHGADTASSVAVSPGGATVFVTGRSRGATSNFDYATIAYNAATGARRWVSRYNGPKNADDWAVSVAAGPGGRSVFVTGTSLGRASGYDYATIAYNAATGAPRWTRRYNGPVVDGGDFAASVKVSPAGTAVFVTGNSGSGSESDPASDYATVGYNAVTGARLWASFYGGPAGQSYASGLAVSPDGTKVFVTGGTAGDTLPWESATVAYQR